MKTRREFLATALSAGVAAPLIAQGNRPQIVSGVMSGEPSSTGAMIWSRTDRPSRMIVNWRTSERGERHRVVSNDFATPDSDFTLKLPLTHLPAGQRILYEVQFESSSRELSEPARGHFITAPAQPSKVRFTWSGDVAGQGWGINKDWGGMRGFDAVRRREPDFFIHSGDTIYADVPIHAEVKLPDGTIWKNVITEAKSKVAETLDEFRGNYHYNLLDDNIRQFQSEVAQVWQWDDHEVMNNWSPGRDLSADNRYREKDIRKIAARSRQAFLEYSPIPRGSNIYRKIAYGPLLDMFMLDMRSYRAANNYNRQTDPSGETVYLGAAQIDWLKRELAASKAAWKVIASDMPLGVLVTDGKDAEGRTIFENSANGDGPVLGREFEIAELLRFMKQRNIRNTVWLTADIHYTAAHYFNPEKAQFTDFLPFWEFVSGPLHAGTFGPNVTDNTFGIEVKYQKCPPKGQGNLAPSAGMQFFGEVEIDPKSRAMTVVLRDLAGSALFTQTIEA
ncbi:MAG TPA: alkaline phosphatase D family protein [Bryobacteraceae bacterium]